MTTPPIPFRLAFSAAARKAAAEPLVRLVADSAALARRVHAEVFGPPAGALAPREAFAAAVRAARS